MRSRELLVLAGFAMVMSTAQAQFTQEITLGPDLTTAGRYVGGAGFSHLAPAGFSDTVFFTVPVEGALDIDLAFLPFPGVPEGANFFQAITLDSQNMAGFGTRVDIGPLDIAAGRHRLDIVGAATIPHGVPLQMQPVGAYSVAFTLLGITPAIPEPPTWLLFVSALAAGLFLVRRTRNA